MRYIFWEWHGFSEKLHRVASKEDYWVLQNELMSNPEKGDLIPGLGGARKIRMAIRRQGKKGGARVIYYFKLDTEIWFLDLYAKNDKADLSPTEKKIVSRNVATIKEYR